MKRDEIINKFTEKCKERFRKDLVSVVLFGSYARGTAKEYSDIDLLVIAKNLPKDWRERDKVLNDVVMDFIMKYSVRVFPIFATPRAMETSLRFGNPLLYGILTGYKILVDEENFFHDVMENLGDDILREKPIFYDKVKEWNLAEIVQRERSLQGSL